MKALFTALLVLAATAQGCARAPLAFPGAPVVLISIDTVRADRLPAYGHSAGRTPAIDRLAREGVLFEDAFSHCPLTLPAHASLLTGLLPPHHGVRDNGGFSLSSEHATLASLLKASGYRTAAAVSAFVLRRSTGIGRGFDYYEDRLPAKGSEDAMADVQRDGAVTAGLLERWIEAQGGERFFAFLHLYEPHAPYAPPERYRSLADPYDGEIAYADEIVGRFVDALRRRGVLDNALVVLTADHGEGLRDHGEQEHGVFLYREALRVPLIVRLPRATRSGLRVAGLVAQSDIAPTILDLLGLPGGPMDGRSEKRAIDGTADAGRPVYSETLYPRLHFGWSELYASTEPRFRYIRAPRPELYDVRGDPSERVNVISAQPQTAAAMARWLEASVTSTAMPSAELIAKDVREKLAALGYIGAAPPPAGAAPLADPKDRIASHEALKQAFSLRSQGHDAEAVAALQKVLATNPAMIDAWLVLGLTLVRMDRTKEAESAFGKVLAIDPGNPEANLAQARLCGLSGRRERARHHAELALSKSPAEAREVLAQLAMDEGHWQAAAELAQKSADDDDRRAMSLFILGVVAQQAGRCEDALAWFRRAEEAERLETQSVLRNLHASMADCLARLGRGAEAEREFRAEIERIPSSHEAHVGLAMLYRSQGRDQEARDVLAGLVAAERRPDAETYWAVVRTLNVLGDQEAAKTWAARARALFPADRRFR